MVITLHFLHNFNIFRSTEIRNTKQNSSEVLAVTCMHYTVECAFTAEWRSGHGATGWRLLHTLGDETAGVLHFNLTHATARFNLTFLFIKYSDLMISAGKVGL